MVGEGIVGARCPHQSLLWMRASVQSAGAAWVAHTHSPLLGAGGLTGSGVGARAPVQGTGGAIQPAMVGQCKGQGVGAKAGRWPRAGVARGEQGQGRAARDVCQSRL